jgi:hypothetical protein
LGDGSGTDEQYQRELNAFLARLSHEQRRLYAAVESNHLGRGGVRTVAGLTGMCGPTIARGRRELADLLQGKSIKKERKPTTGRPRVEQKYPGITAAMEELLCDEVAGNPQDDSRWVRSSVRKIAEQLRQQGFTLCNQTVWALLRRMRFSLRMNVITRRGPTKDPVQRDEQFEYMRAQRKAFFAAGLPVISVDTKKKELIGNFKSPGRAWCRQPVEVDSYDFASQAECVATPFGVYDMGKNTGFVVVGLSHNTPEFAASTIARWWKEEGRLIHPQAHELLMFADGGGANGSRARAWKLNLQEKVCDPFNLTVTVCHYPPGCSKWNPIEYRLFSPISLNWEGKPLRSLGVMLAYIRGTTTTTGLTVKAYLDEGIYRKKQKVTKEDMAKVNVKPHPVCPSLNYTISPRQSSPQETGSRVCRCTEG